MEIRYFKYCHYEYVARVCQHSPRTCTLWARGARMSDELRHGYASHYLGRLVDGRLEPNRAYLDGTYRGEHSIRRGCVRLYEMVERRFVADVEKVYTRFMAERKGRGQPANLRALKFVASIMLTHPELSDRELARKLAKRMGRERIDPKTAWRWKQMVRRSVALLG